jgi:hypothetical protein
VDKRTAGGAGLALALLSAATFGTSGSFAASLIEAGWTPARPSPRGCSRRRCC